jgi:hypothetical protein
VTTYTPEEYAAHLRTSGKRLNEAIVPVLNRAAFNIRDGWQKRAREANRVHAPDYAQSIQRGKLLVERNTFTVTVEPIGRGQGPFGMILEYGTPTSAPQLSHVAALKEELPNLMRWTRKVASEVPR